MKEKDTKRLAESDPRDDARPEAPTPGTPDAFERLLSDYQETLRRFSAQEELLRAERERRNQLEGVLAGVLQSKRWLLAESFVSAVRRSGITRVPTAIKRLCKSQYYLVRKVLSTALPRPVKNLSRRFYRRSSPPLESAPPLPMWRGVFDQRPLALRIAMIAHDAYLPWWQRQSVDQVVTALRSCGHNVTFFPAPTAADIAQTVRQADIVLVCDQPYSESLRQLVSDVRTTFGVVVGCVLPEAAVVFGPEVSQRDSRSDDPRDLFNACDLVTSITDAPADCETDNDDDVLSTLPFMCQPEYARRWVEALIKRHRRRALPSVSVVTVLYKKEREIPFFIKVLAEQDYPGAMELIVVDDCSPDASVATLRQEFEAQKARGLRLPSLTVLSNRVNSGNCYSRNAGLQEASGDVVVIVDCDCLLNRSFINAHVYSHIFHETDVVIGPCNLETGEREPLRALEDFDVNRHRVLSEAGLQDPINLDSFTNCITRNFSIQRRFVTEQLFDERFGYSADPNSGFGWEDVEMGYRLFKRGLRIHFSVDAFSVHISHLSTTEDSTKPLRSLKNFRRLLDKHPAIKTEARRWCCDTFEKIESWSAQCGHPVGEDQEHVRSELGEMYPYPFAIKRKRPLRILTYRWHVPHQYELYKLPHEFTLLNDLGTNFTHVWEWEQRPKPRNAILRAREEIRIKDYDLAILHFDENVLSPEMCNGVISPDWGANFAWFMNEVKGMPKVAICHGTPQFIGQYRPDYHGPDLGTPIEHTRALLVEYVGAMPVVCNSRQAAHEWGFKNSRVIWHGFDPTEFLLTSYSGGIVTLGKSMKERPYYRGYQHFTRVCELLPEDMRPSFHAVTQPRLFPRDSEIYARLKFESYKASLREYSVYFNPTLRSPMPRCRGEAMMSGLVSVSAANHDVQLFIKNGWNGFYADTSEELAEHLLFLMRNKKACREIGARSRETAADLFNHDRYLRAWQSLLGDIRGERV